MTEYIPRPRPTIARICEWCGDEFPSKSPTHTCCNEECRKKMTSLKQMNVRRARRNEDPMTIEEYKALDRERSKPKINMKEPNWCPHCGEMIADGYTICYQCYEINTYGIPSKLVDPNDYNEEGEIICQNSLLLCVQ